MNGENFAININIINPKKVQASSTNFHKSSLAAIMPPMPTFWRRFMRRQKNRKRKSREIDPDEILIDSHNLPCYDTTQFEGRLEKPIARTTLYAIMGIFIFIIAIIIVQAGQMQIVNGSDYRAKSENNLLRPVPIFAGRGVIYDRNGVMLAWNAPPASVNGTTTENTDEMVSNREYATSTGLAHVLGYVQYPSKDNNGYYYQDDFEGIAGSEKYFNVELSGTSGSRLVEVNAHGKIISENVVEPPIQGQNFTLSIDSRVQSALYNNIKDIATRVGFSGGAGVIMDVHTGELLALTSYPEYDPQVMSDKTDQAAVKSLLSNPGLPFLDRAVDGLYTPGSIIKPYLAIAVQNEGVIDPSTVIVTTGSISIPNPYDPTKTTIFRDWKDLGSLDLRHAIAMSSDAYFYTVGGGYKDQKGLGIANIDKYLRMFGFGTTTLDGGDSYLMDKAGTIPTPEWKMKTFNESWFLGDTYHTSIGQYGVQVTPMQIVRGMASIASEGAILTPTIIKGQTPHVEAVVDIPKQYFDVVHEGMRLGTQIGTSVALNVPYVKVAGKSGTAELGVTKDRVNSWITGFWPYDNPKYAFVVMLEKGSVHNLIGAAAAMRQQLDWMDANTPEYFQ
jgi:penicillin-binding protein 2